MKVIAFGASYSKQSINKQFASYVAQQISSEAETLDLNNYQLPVYTIDLEREIGHPQAAIDFVHKLEEADVLVISIAEHNGSYTAAFKNLFDWASRVKLKLFEDMRVVLLSTAPGARGGISALEDALDRFPRHGGEIVGHFTLPNFNENFSEELGVTHDELRERLHELVNAAMVVE
ncbi:MAG: NAD(P)H-dependent oxidoreductase [Bacteroidota bacterium]